MTTAGNVLALLGAIVTTYGLWRVWRRTASPLAPGPAQTIAPAGIPSGEAFGTPTVRNVADTFKRWARFGRPIHHTGGADLEVTVTTTAGGEVTRGGTEPERLARIEQQIDALAEQHASSRAEDLKRNAQLIKQEINDYRAAERATTRRQTVIAAIGMLMTITGIVLRILAG